MNINIYISALLLDTDKGEEISPAGTKLVEELKAAGYKIHMPLEWKEYSEIEEEIDQSDALIALVDKYWTSSTWKAPEVTYALNGVGAFEVTPKDKPIPTFIFWNEKPLDLPFLGNLNKPVYLSQDVSKAVEEVNNCFRYTAIKRTTSRSGSWTPKPLRGFLAPLSLNVMCLK